MKRALYAATEGVRQLLGEFVTVLDLTHPDAELSPESILRGQVTVRADGTADGRAQLTVYGRAYDPEDRGAILEVVQQAEALMNDLKSTTCTVDVVLLLGSLIKRRTAVEEDAETSLTLSELHRRACGIDCIELRVWLLDGRASDGRVYELEDVRGILAVNTPADMTAALPPGAFNFHSFGARAAVFPRGRIIGHVEACYAHEVLTGSARLRVEPVPYAVATLACADFVRSPLLPILEKIDKDEQGGTLLGESRMPAVVPDKPLSITLAELDEAASQRARDLETARASIDRNYSRAVSEISDELSLEVHGFVDDPGTGLGMAHAFLDLLETGESVHVVDTELSGARQSTLREAFGPALKHLDAVTGFDSAKRDQLLEADQSLWANREWLEKLKADIAAAEERAAGADAKVAVEIEVLRGQVSEVEQTIAGLVTTTNELRSEIIRQDLRVSGPGSRAIEDELWTVAQAEIAEARETAAKAEQAVEDATARLRNAERALQSLLWDAAKKGGIFLLGMIAIGVLGLLLMPVLFGAVPLVGKPLFGFIGTVAAAAWTKWWGLGTIVSVVAYLLQAVIRYLVALKEIKGLTAARESAVAGYLRTLRAYWDLRMNQIREQIDLRRNSHALKIEGALREHCTTLCGMLADFEGAINAMTEQLAAEIDSFAVVSSVSEFVVVDDDYAESIVERNRSRITDLASHFFEAHLVSGYLAAFQGAGDLSLLRADLANHARDEFDHLVGERTVLEVLKRDDARRRVVRDLAVNIPVLSLLDSRGSWSDATMILGSDQRALEDEFGGMAPQPIVGVIDDPERLLFARVVHGIEVEGISS